MTKGILWLTIPDQVSPVKRLYNPAKHLHVTLKFDVTLDSIRRFLDKEVTVELIENCWNDEIQAIKVKLPATYASLCKNKCPHITISHKSGVKPFKSNAMLEADHKSDKLKQTLKMRTEFFPFDAKEDEKQ